MVFLLRGDRTLARALAGARVGVRPLAAHRKIPAVTQSAIALNFDQAPDVHLGIFAKIAFHSAFGFDGGAQTGDFLFGEILDLLGGIDVRLFSERTRAGLPDAVDRRQADPKPLVRR